jgi:prevent-host-death family protein
MLLEMVRRLSLLAPRLAPENRRNSGQESGCELPLEDHRGRPAVPAGSSPAALERLCLPRCLGELVTEARHSHRPITISEDGKPVAALIDIDDLADLEDRAALAAHLADKADGRAGVSIDELDAALDRIDAATCS